MKKSKLNISSVLENKNWDQFLKGDLNFHSTTNFTTNFISSDINNHELDDGSKVIHINSSPYSSKLKYLNSKNTIFIVNSISTLVHRNDCYSTAIQCGSSVLLPSNTTFFEDSKKDRKSISLILNTDNICSEVDLYILNNMLWKTSSENDIDYGLDKIFHKLYGSYTDSFVEQSVKFLISVLQYHIEKKKTSICYLKPILCRMEIEEVISQNFKNSEFNLKVLSKKIGVSERTIQNTFAKYDIKFLSYLQKKRTIELRYLIQNNPFLNLEYLSIQSGFSSFEAANRAFIKEHRMSLRCYVKNLRLGA